MQVTRTVAQARELGPALSSVFQTQGFGAYTNTEAAAVGGVLLSITQVLSLVLAIGFAVPRLRTRRRAWWIPVVCAVVAFLAATAIVIGMVLVDPAYLARLRLPA